MCLGFLNYVRVSQKSVPFSQEMGTSFLKKVGHIFGKPNTISGNQDKFSGNQDMLLETGTYFQFHWSVGHKILKRAGITLPCSCQSHCISCFLFFCLFFS